MQAPVVSVLMPSYNHARYVRRTIDSVLAQTGVDFEFLVEDDGSSDGSADLIAAIRDPRLQLFRKERNEGAYATHNNLLQRARGEFVAVINSDDVWPAADKLAYQVSVLRADPSLGATFGWAAYIDEQGRKVPKDATFLRGIFDQPNRSRGQWLRQFFESGNCLCHPTVMLRRECHERLGPYDNRFRQVADWEMWLRLVKRYGIHVSERELVEFRAVTGGNTSFPTEGVVHRTWNELYQVVGRIFDGADEPLMREGFGELLLCPDAMGQSQLEVEKVLLHFRAQGHFSRLHRPIALGRLFEMLGQQEYRAILADYGINDLWLHEENARGSVFSTIEAAVPAASPAPAGPRGSSRGAFSRYLSFLRK